jgi:Ca2+/Na+ antiporter
MFLEAIKFIIYSGLIVIISKYILVVTLRKLAENLNLKPKTVGDVAGLATSMPELLTIGASSFKGLIGTSIVNVLSSNIINLIQYLASITINNNKASFRNKAIKVDFVLVIATIMIPLIMSLKNIEVNVGIVPIFIILYALFRYLNNNAHKLYLKKEDKKIEKGIEEETEKEKGNTRKTLLYISILIFTGILLFAVGELLGGTLDVLCNSFQISQTIIGILLGFITSIPELITFFEAQKHYKKAKEEEILGVVEATNNLLTSNVLNLFIIQSIGIIIYEIFH